MARVFPLVLRKSNPKNLGRLGTQGMLHGSMNIRYPKNYKLNKENHNPLDLRFFECPKCTSRCKHFTLHQGAPKIDSTAFTSTRHTSQVPGRCASRRFAPESCDVFPWNSPDGILWIFTAEIFSLQFRKTCNGVNPINKPPITGDGSLFGLPNGVIFHLATGSCSMRWRSLLVPRTSNEFSMIRKRKQLWNWMDMGIGQNHSKPWYPAFLTNF